MSVVVKMRRIKIFYILLVIFANYCSGDDIIDSLCEDLSSISKKDISEKCLAQLDRICSQEWSVLFKMFDASSKYPINGLLYSSNQDFGNYDECLAIEYEDTKMKILGKHCTYGVSVFNRLIPKDPWMPQSIEKQPGQYDFRQDIRDLKALREVDIPYLRTDLSVCIPDQCTPQEVGKYFIIGNISLFYYSGAPCVTNEPLEFTSGDIAFIAVLGVILFCIVCCTCYDIILYYTQKESKHPLLLSFSFLTNGRKLLHISKKGDQIQCLNGLRFISMVWVLSGHGMALWQQLPVTNEFGVQDWRNHWYNQYIASAPIAVDTFFFLSGFLWAYGYLKMNLEAPVLKQVSSVPIMIIHRYLRLTPAVAMLYFTSITIFKFLGAGPLYANITETLKTQCERRWWQFFLYVQNYVNPDDMCLNHSWYLSADMQMFLLSPLVLIPTAIFAKKHFKRVLISLVALTLFCTVFPIVHRFVDETYANNYDTHSRLQDYLIGIIFGVILRLYGDRKFPFTKVQNFIIWVVVLLVTLAWNIYYNEVISTYEHTEDTLFYGLYRPLWGIALVWIIYSCHNGHGGFINWILTRPIFQVGARLSYCMYLLHAVLEAHWLGLQRTPMFFSNWSVFYIFGGHFVVTMIASAIWTLAFESPMIIIDKYLVEMLMKMVGLKKKA